MDAKKIKRIEQILEDEGEAAPPCQQGDPAATAGLLIGSSGCAARLRCPAAWCRRGPWPPLPVGGAKKKAPGFS